MSWHADIEGVLKKYLSAPAAEVGLTLLSAFYTAERITAGHLDDESKGGVIRMLVGLTFGLPNNPWFQKHHGFVMPVFSIAVSAWLDAIQYMQKGKGSEAQAISTRATIMEVASAVLLADKGIAEGRKLSIALRDDLALIRME